MSSYRSSYQPWKTSLPSNYKSGASSAYSSRDDVSTTPRYTSLASPSSYRPSFSGGTYRLKRDTPITPASTYVSRYSGTSSAGVAKPDTELKRYGSNSSNLGKYSREPSPAALEHTNRIKSRDPSPVTRTLRGRSRDPSPALDTKCKIGYGTTNAYRMNVPKSPVASSYNTHNTRYGGASTASTRSSTTSSSSLADKSISYLSASDFNARSITKAKETATRKSNEKELEKDTKEQVREVIKQEEKEYMKEETKAEGAENTEEAETSEEEEIFISVSVCTRATSPTPPGSNTIVHRTRRLDIAKTIEKTIQRSTKKKKMLDKEIQSDRLDDSTRYSRYGLSGRLSSYSPHTERYSSSTTPRYSNSPLSIASKSTTPSSNTDSKKEDTATSSSCSLSSKVNKIPASTKSKLSPPKSVKLNSRQSSQENLSAQKPPAAPKGESPGKSASTSANLSNIKLPNKDFRKSALNVGPTDRPRKSRTPSTGTDSDLNTVEALNGALQAIQRLERSPSAGSEISNVSSRSVRRTTTETKLRAKCHNKPLTTTSRTNSPLRRTNSTTNLKSKSSTASTPQSSSSPSSGTPSTTTTTTASSSSGTESSTENKKSTKKIIKKKSIKDVTLSNSSTGINDMPNIKSSNENSFSLQQPPAALATNSTKSKKSDSSTTSRTTPKTPSSDKDPLRRLKKLSSVSNFFATQQKDQTNSDEQIYLESSENSSGNDLDRGKSQKSISLTQANETKTPLSPTPPAKTKNNNNSSSSKSDINYTENSIDETKKVLTKSTKSKSKSKTKSKSSSTTSSSYCPQDTTTVNEESSRMPTELQTESLSPYTTTNPTTSSTSGTDQDESSWWQDTSRQIDTASALDFNLKDDMRFKIRHIDSGETAWWLRNDEDDTLADDDLKTLNQEEEEELGNEEAEDDDEATDQLKSLNSTETDSAAKLSNGKVGWWITDTEYDEKNDNNETNFINSRSSNDAALQTNGYCVGVDESSVEEKPFPKSRITPEKDWWIEDDAANEIKNCTQSPKSQTPSIDSKSSKQNGSVQLKICRVESGEKPWWIQEQEQQDLEKETDITVEATISLPKKITAEKLVNSSSNSDSKNLWVSGPTKKLFNIPRVESGEKAWWQQEESTEQKTEINDKDKSSKIYKRNDSQEQEWWLEDNVKQATPPQQIQNDYCQSPAHQYSLQTDNDVVAEELQRYNHQMDSQAELSNSFSFEYSERPPPLGQCASPVQLEVPQQRQQHCKSPYDNIPMTKVQNLQQLKQNQMPNLETATNFNGALIYQQQQQQHLDHLQQHQPYPTQQQYFPHQRQQQQQQHKYQTHQQQSPPHNNNELRSSNGKLFISRHQNIDELLGGSCRPISPLFYDNINSGSFQLMPSPPPPPQRNMFVEEITPDQVRIHDSTAQMPIIQRMERDNWERDDTLAAKTTTTPPRFEQRMTTDEWG